jgi:hypothetical protein
VSLPSPTNNAPVAAPGRVGQATAVEQSRAVAEVAAAVQVAQLCPRNTSAAREEMKASCSMIGLAERAFYKFPRGSETVQGPSVYLARDLARCWGNVQYGIAELRRDDEHGESEMQAWAWDVQTNTRSSNTFIVPHKRDKKGGAVRLVDMRDIYENNTNQGSRRVREAIFSVLPPWFTAEAEELCKQTVEKGDGKPLPERIDAIVKAYDGLGVTLDRLERKLGQPRARWTAFDVAQLTIAGKSIRRGEITVEDEFPPQRVTLDEITAPAPATATTPTNGDTAPPAASTEAPKPAKTAAAKKAPAAATEDAPPPTNGELQYAPDDDGRPFTEGDD